MNEAETYLNAAIEKRGGNYPDAWLRLGEVYAAQNKFDLAKKAYIDVIKLKPKLSSPHLSLSKLYEKENDHDRALATIIKAYETSPNNLKLGLQYSHLLFIQSKYIENEALLRKITIAYPKKNQLKQLLADNYFALNNFSKSSAIYNELLATDKSNFELWYKLSDSLFREQQFLLAVTAANSSYSATPDAEDDSRARTLKLRSNIFLALKKYKLAIADLEEVLTIFDNKADARLDLADALWLSQSRKLAERELSLVLRTDKNNCRALKMAIDWDIVKYKDQYNKSTCSK